MKGIMPGFAIGTLALCVTMGMALGQSNTAPSASSPTAAPPATASQPTATDQASPADQPAQAGGMQDTSMTKSEKAKDCSKEGTKTTHPSAASSTTGCEKPQQ